MRANAFTILMGLLIVAAWPALAADATALEGGGWRLVQVRGADGLEPAADEGRRAELRFSAGRLTGGTGCNRLMGAYEIDGDRLTIKPSIATTMMACPEPLMVQERAVTEALGRTERFRIDDGTLTLTAADGTPLMMLSERMDRPLAGTQWRLTAYNNGKQAVVSVLPQSRFMLQLRADGQLAGKACNNYRGGYERDGKVLRLVGPIAATRMACPRPEGIMEQESAYFAALERVAGFRLEGDELILVDAHGATLARLQAAID